MPRNGSGVYTLPAGNPVVSGTPIEASWANPTMTDLGNEITNSLPRNGTAPMTANLPMGGFKVTGQADGTASSDSATVGNVTSYAATWIQNLPPGAPQLTDLAALYTGAGNISATLADILALAGQVAVPPASETVQGVTELATAEEVLAGIDTTRIVTPFNLRQSGLGVYKALQVGSTKTLAVADVGQYVYNDAGALTITTPSSADATIPSGSRIDFAQIGTGTMTFVAGSGVTITGSAGLVLRQNKAATLVRISSTVWHLIGGATT